MSAKITARSSADVRKWQRSPGMPSENMRQTTLCQLHANNTLTRAIAGPRPLHRARTPSCAIVFRAQSMNPEYVPVGADWIRDLRTCMTSCQHQGAPEQHKALTSGGIAIDHIAMPAMPPATMTAPRFRSDGDDPTGVNARFVTSYAAKYLARIRLGDRAEEYQ